MMSQRAHFWIRIVGLTAILIAEFGPRIWSGGTATTSGQGARVADVVAEERQP
jgi:hypothetical protein